MMRSANHRTATAAIAIGAAMALVGSAAIAAPGSDGLGDPYFPDYGNSGYDVTHYIVDVTYTPQPMKLSGHTRILATATQDLTSFNLDFLLDTTRVRVNGRDAAFRMEGAHELVVTPASTIRRNSPMVIEVEYAGDPTANKPYGWSSAVQLTDGGALVLGEPEAAWWWFPSNDHPSDKAQYDVNITAPNGMTAMSAGRLLGSSPRGKDATTWRWQLSHPTATYLTFLAVGQYNLTSGKTPNGLPWWNATPKAALPGSGVEQAWIDRAHSDLARTPEVVEWESGEFGPYPFEATGGVVPLATFGFALENQTRPVYSPRFWRRGNNMGVIVHEQAHQWFGDSVSVKDWSDIWCNEAFATWAQWRWGEAKDNVPANDFFKERYQSIPADDEFWSIKLSNPGPDEVFSGAVYYRGAMSLQALRNRVGDNTFKQILTTWTSSKRYGNGSTEEFRALAQRISGQDLTEFFRVWLDTPTKPEATAANGIPNADWANPPAAPGQNRVAGAGAQVIADHVAATDDIITQEAARARK